MSIIIVLISKITKVLGNPRRDIYHRMSLNLQYQNSTLLFRMNCIGKLLIAASVSFQAYLLLNHPTSFDQQSQMMIKQCSALSTFSAFSSQLKYIVIFLLALSVLTVFLKSALIKILVIVGLIIQISVNFYPIDSLPKLSNFAFWQQIAVIGGFVYMMGSDCECSEKTDQKLSQDNSQSRKK